MLSAEGYEVTSIATCEYNCIAFAADDDESWWWPDQHGKAYWPPNIKREVTIDAFVSAYETIGYERWEYKGNGDLESGYDKIAIYAMAGVPTHASKQLSDGRWKSKLGPWEDIEHNTPRAVETHGAVGIYGEVEVYMRKKKP